MTAVVFVATVDVLTVKLADEAPERTATGRGARWPSYWNWTARHWYLLETLPLRANGARRCIGGRQTGWRTGQARKNHGSQQRQPRTVFETELRVAVMTAVVFTRDGRGVHGEVGGGRARENGDGRGPRVADPLELESATAVLLAAAPLRLTVTCRWPWWASRLAGVQDRFERTTAGVKVSVNGLDTGAEGAVMTALVLTATADVLTVKLAVAAPERTVTEGRRSWPSRWSSRARRWCLLRGVTAQGHRTRRRARRSDA